jgi:hypothetical protein
VAQLRRVFGSAGFDGQGQLQFGAPPYQIRCIVSNACGPTASGQVTLTVNSADFDGDADVGTDADIGAFFACIGGTCCPMCGSADFNGDGDTGTDADIERFFRVLAGGPCPPRRAGTMGRPPASGWTPRKRSGRR